MSNEPRLAPESNDDAKATAPLPATPPSTAPDAERSTLPLPGNTPTPTAPALPERIGRFEVRSWLGSGAFGDVYRAHDPQLDREVALKVAKPGSLDTPERIGRFLREAKAAANLRHPNIVPLYETGRDGDRLFIAAAFIPGRTLEAVIQEANEKGEPIPLDTAARIIRKLADALAYAHSQGVVHRDVKPANVIIDDKGEPLLLDFGLASRAQAGDERLTTDGQGMGTPAYMAREQADGHGTAASDQYSLGCAFYELVTGQTPFGGGPAQQIFLHKSQPVPSPRKLRRDVPRDLDTVILKCVEKEPSRRYASCGELAEDLRRFLDSEPVKARRIGSVERLARWAKRNPAVASSVTAAVMALIVGSGVSVAFGLEAKEQAQRADHQRDEARAQEAIAKQSLEALYSVAASHDPLEQFFPGQLNPLRPGSDVASGPLEQTRAQMAAVLANRPRERARFEMILGNILRSRGDWHEATSLLQNAVRTLADAPTATLEERAIAFYYLGWLQREVGDLREAEQSLRSSLQQLPAGNGQVHRLAPDIAFQIGWTLGDLAAIGSPEKRAERKANAVEAMKTAETLYREIGGETAEVKCALCQLAVILITAADQQVDLIQLQGVLSKLSSRDELAKILLALVFGEKQRQLRNHVEAIRQLTLADDLLRQLLGSSHPIRLQALASLAEVHHQTGDKANRAIAERLMREVIGVGRKKWPHHPRMVEALEELAKYILGNGGNLQEACNLVKEAEVIVTRHGDDLSHARPALADLRQKIETSMRTNPSK